VVPCPAKPRTLSQLGRCRFREQKDPYIRVVRDRIQALVQAWAAVPARNVVVEDPEVGQRRLDAAELGLLQQHA
jgi:hypothetical protein